jgi:hypothetical protein
LAELHEGATGEIHAIISKTADAYEEASHLSPACTAAAYHARFLRELVAQDIFRSKQQKAWEDGHSRCKLRSVRRVMDSAANEIFPTVVRRDSTQSSQQSTQPSVYPQQMLDDAQNTANMHHSYSYPISPTQSNVAASSQEPMQVDTSRSASVQATSAQTYGNSAYVQSPPVASQPQPTQSDDLRYWNNMFRDLGFGEAVDQNFPAQQNISSASAPSSHQSLPMTSSHHQTYGNGRGAGPPQQPYAYHHMHSNAPGYGL